MKYRLRKQKQREVNKEVKRFNECMAYDELFLGRFVMQQLGSDYISFDDHSGGILYVELRLIDKATGYYKDFLYEHHTKSRLYRLWQFANKFITEDSGAWDNGAPEAVDYRNKSVPEVSKEKNYFVSYKYFEV